MDDMNIVEYLLAKKKGGGGDIDVEALNVTDNGTYTAETGKAYSPVVVNLPLDEKTITENGEYNASDDDLKGFSRVNVNVPLPSNAYLKKSVSGLPASIASFTASDAPLDSLKVGIECVQSGSGEPSPTNVRPISGWSGANVNVDGKNLLNNSAAEIGKAWHGGDNANRARLIVPCKPNTTYTYSRNSDLIVNNIYIATSPTVPASSAGNEYTSLTSTTFTTSADDNYIIFAFSKTNISQSDIDSMQLQIELGTRATAYEPYNGKTVTIQFGQTVYGGILDVTGGTLTITSGYIASYNGEALPSTWISDRDVYAEGTTPTTGAEVVYELATPTTISLTPMQIRSLLSNNIFADCGDVGECKYFEKE